MDAYGTLLSRIPGNAPAGKSKVIRAALGLTFKGALAEAAKRDDLTAKGKAGLIEKQLKATTGPALAKARRQLAYHERAIERQRAAIHAKAIGAHDPLDAERRAVLRGMSTAERVQAVMTDATFRLAALRGGAGLSGLNEEIFSRMTELAIAENAGPEAAALAAAEEAQDLHNAAVKMLAYEIAQAPVVVEPNGAVRNFDSPHEMENFLATHLHPVAPHIVMREEIEADHVEEAA
jgi:hypothetical protein